MQWRVAKSLDKLLKQLNEKFPNRSKISDGSIGDERHQSKNSDHNPWIKLNKVGIVTARDFTHDPKNLDCNLLLNALIKSNDSRIKYIIFNKKIYNIKNGFKPKNYNGINAHKHHLHLSVSSDVKLFDDDSDWKLDFNNIKIINQETDVKVNENSVILKRGDKNSHVRKVQQILHEKGYLKGNGVDGDFGPNTELAVKNFQRDNKLKSDGIVGKNTYLKLGIIY